MASDLERRRSGGGQRAGGFGMQRLAYACHVLREGGPQQVVSERKPAAVVDQNAGPAASSRTGSKSLIGVPLTLARSDGENRLPRTVAQRSNDS